MEIYTTDLVDIAIAAGEAIEKELALNGPYKDYVIVDGCCNLQNELCGILYDRLSIAFHDIITRSKDADFNLEEELFKTINNL